MASRRTITAWRVCIGILSAALLPGSHFRLTTAASAAPAESPKATQPESVATATGPAQVSDIIIQTGNAGQTFVDVATSIPTPYRVLQLMNPRRLVVDLEGAHKATPQKSYASESPLLKRVRVGQFQGESPAVVRVVADLNGNPTFDVHSTPGGVRIELKPRQLMQRLVVPETSREAEDSVRQNATAPPPQPMTPPALPVSEAPPISVQPSPSQIPSMPNALPSSNAFFRQTPFRSLTQNQRLLDSLGLRIVLNFNYKMGGTDEAAWKTKGASGVEANRLFLKPTGTGSYRTIELAVTVSPDGGYELVVYGQQVDGTAQGANPDLTAVQQLVNDEVTRVAQMPPAPIAEMNQLGYETYYLSYVGADRAIALLKTMGYTTVEYNEQAGDTLYDKIYNPIKLGNGRPPIVVKLIDSSKTSLMEPSSSQSGVPGQAGMPQMAQPQGGFGPTTSGVPAIGGSFLSYMTSGEPQQRLLILYDKDDRESLQSLVNLLQTTVDMPSREIMIEALVIELNSDRTRNLGITLDTTQNKAEIFSVGPDPSPSALPGALTPFTFAFDKLNLIKIASFNATLTALLKTGEAEILSNPSVLVLDGRQARIQIGQQVPVVKQTFNQINTVSSVDYFPVGIVLNLRPRINESGDEITMQTETIVSAINSNTQVGTAQFAPVIDNRQVQSIVRVADNTPFIIGGLISNENRTSMSGIPLLSQIPGLGALFRTTSVRKLKNEVIIVITPHVVPLQDKYFSYVIPKDSDQFDRFNYKLFRNAYRIRGNDLFDLDFVYDSNVYKQLVRRVTVAEASNPNLKKSESFASVLKGGAPGEDILVRRMLWEIIDKTQFARHVSQDQIIFFENNPSAPGGSGFQLAFLRDKLKGMKGGKNGLALKFEAQPQGTEERPFVPPKALVEYPSVTVQSYPQLLINGNDRNPDGSPRDWTVLLSQERLVGLRVPPIELLRGVLVLKRILELNRSMPLTLKEFHIGRQIIFPSQEELQQGYHIVDRQVAQLFYEVYNYYPAFEQEFNRETRQMNATLDKVTRQQ